jgi:hypothetical protein
MEAIESRANRTSDSKQMFPKT